MFTSAHAGREKLFGRFSRILFLGIAALAVTPNLFAQGKGLYYGGCLHEFAPEQGFGVQYTRYTWDGTNATDSCDNDWPANPSGNFGACIFNGAPYCFFTTTEGKLQYVVENLDFCSEPTPVTTIATGVGTLGAAAAVCGDAIYVFTANQAFTSKDGTNFAVYPLASGLPASKILDAVTFYPTNNLPAGIMVIYNDMGNPPNLNASAIYPPNNVWSGGALPWPPANPALWAPITQGNLVLGTSGGGLGAPGATEPCIQFYGLTGTGQDGPHQGRWEYNVATSTWHFYDWTFTKDITFVDAFPWADTVDSDSGLMRFSHLVSCWGSGGNTIKVNLSDWMVPQHNDPVYGWAGTPTVTSTATGNTDEAQKLRALWSLVGIVLGPPPFALNGAADAHFPIVLSDVQYGIDQSSSITMQQTSSQTLSVAMNNSIKAGFGQFSLDLSYAHAWTASHGATHTVAVSTFYDFGPVDETAPNQGTHGWALFSAPTFVTQLYKVYAYDYNQSTGSGTYLNQDIYATSVGAVVPQTTYFTLANPADGGIPGLFQGFPVYPNSTDIPGWLLIRDWNKGGADWAAIFGDQSRPAVGTLNLGVDTQQTYTQTDSTMSSTGNNNSFSVSAGAGFSFFGGFSSGVTVGYDGEFGTSTELDSTITKSVSCSLNMPIPPNTPGYVNSMIIQPYWLQAKTANAPWIPTGYSGNLPWLITWNVLQYNTVGTSTVAGVTAGTAVQPALTSGIIRGGSGDNFKVVTGYLVWVDEHGHQTPLSMSADDFNPTNGAVVSLNSYAFAADRTTGQWVRNGAVWNYTTHPGATDHFALKLDFANKLWSFNVTSKQLQGIGPIGSVAPSNRQIGNVRVDLALPGRALFTSWVQHEVIMTWSHQEAKAAWGPLGVHGLKGDYASQTGVGHLTLKGHIPKKDQQFGDLEIQINGKPITIPLLNRPGFLTALQHGRDFPYKTEDLIFDINFSTGQWTMSIQGNKFHRDMAPKGGVMRVQVRVGGAVSSDQTFQIDKYSTGLSYPY